MDIMSMVLLGSAALVGIIFVSLIFWIISLRRVVPTNMVHIVQSRKTSRPYGRGKEAGNVYYEWPSWIPFIGITVTEFPESIFDVSLTDYDAYDSGRLPENRPQQELYIDENDGCPLIA